MINEKRLIGIVGPCGAGKSTLAEGLKQEGFYARAVAQEHSYVPDMWRRLTNPKILVFLQASHLVGSQRRKLDWSVAEWQEQQERLRDARAHADLFIDTDQLDIASVRKLVMDFLEI